MRKKEELIKKIIENIKMENNPVDKLKIISQDIEDNILQKDNNNELLKNYQFSFEYLNEDYDYITPEFFSDIEELTLSLEKNRYETGSYYTDKVLIKYIFDEIKDIDNKTIIDPAAGTGNFLIYFILKIIHKFNNKKEFLDYYSKFIYFNELKSQSIDIYIKRLNYIVLDKYQSELTESDIKLIKKNCFNYDFLLDFNNNMKFDIIIGNPPYLGTKSLGQDYLKKLYKEFGFTDDLYSLFTYKCIDLLNNNGFFSFVTSNTYFTLKTKLKMRKKMINNGLYKIINNNRNHFNIMSNTAIFCINKSYLKNEVEIYQENNDNTLLKINVLDITKLKKLEYRFSINKNNQDIENLFLKTQDIYNNFKDNISTSKKLSKFKETEEFKELIKNNNVLPLGLIAYIGTGVDFKGNNDKVLYSKINKKYNNINNLKIKKTISKEEFQSGLDEGYDLIKAIKGNEYLYVKWNKETFNYLKSIKAPLRNLHLYGSDMIYCKTSTYEFNKIDKNTLCINTAGACFIKPIIDIDLDYLFQKLNNQDIKKYIKNNINNSLCLTPNDLKIIPITLKYIF
jgi:hypothetical protein